MLRLTILGCGSSGGVPRLGVNGPYWGDCDPKNPKNRRRRCALLVEKIGADGVTRVLIDTGPDVYQQLLDAGVGVLDAVFYTHSHADHVHGIDDLRQIVFNLQRRLPVWADPVTAQDLRARFAYVFEQAAGSAYPPILELHEIHGPVTIGGAGGAITLESFACGHGEIEALGYRIGNSAYLPDAVSIPQAHWPLLDRLQVWIVDALRRAPHPSHAHLDLTLSWIAQARPDQAILTNLHTDLDYDALCATLPAHIRPAYDGLQIELLE